MFETPVLGTETKRLKLIFLIGYPSLCLLTELSKNQPNKMEMTHLVPFYHLTVNDYVYLQAAGEEVDKSWKDMVDQLEVGCQCADSTVVPLLSDTVCSFSTC